jgi:hypothetical protein
LKIYKNSCWNWILNWLWHIFWDAGPSRKLSRRPALLWRPVWRPAGAGEAQLKSPSFSHSMKTSKSTCSIHRPSNRKRQTFLAGKFENSKN